MSRPVSDKISFGFARALDIVFVANPVGTSLGIFTGFVLKGMIAFFSPTLLAFKAVNFAALRTYHLCALGVVGFNIGPYFKRSKIDPRITSAIQFIEDEAEKNNLPEWQRKKMYENLLAKVLANVVLDENTAKEFRSFREMLDQVQSTSETDQ